MASFSLNYSSSEEDQGNTAFPFQYWRSPQPPNPSPFNSDSSDFESQGSPGTSRPETPGTPLSPASSLGGAFSYIDLPLKLPTVQLRNPNLYVGESIPRRSRVLGKRDIRNRLAIFLSLTAPRSKCIRLNVRKVPCFPRCASLYL